MTMHADRWQPGDVVVRREILHGKAWLEIPAYIVEHRQDLMASYIPEGAPFTYPPGNWPTPNGRHPWYPKPSWEGHGVLMLQRPNEAYAVWHFWHGPERRFDGWYLNLQEPYRRTVDGYETQDLELDIVVALDGSWAFKDSEHLDTRVAEGRFTRAKVDEIISTGNRIAAMIDSGETWWDPAWAAWAPPPGWDAGALKLGR